MTRLYELLYCLVSAADGTTKVVTGSTSILPKTPQAQTLNQSSLIKITQTGKLIYLIFPFPIYLHTYNPICSSIASF